MFVLQSIWQMTILKYLLYIMLVCVFVYPFSYALYCALLNAFCSCWFSILHTPPWKVIVKQTKFEILKEDFTLSPNHENTFSLMKFYSKASHTGPSLQSNLTCFESRLEWLALWRCLLEVHVIDGAGVHGRWALSGRLRPWSSVWDEGAHCQSWWRIQSLAQPGGEKRHIRLEGGAWRHWNSLLDLLGGWACGGGDVGPSRCWRVWEWARRRRILAALQGAGRVCGSEVRAIRRRLWLGYGRGGHSHFWV